MNESVEKLIKLVREAYSCLSDDHITWDQWATKVQEHNRSRQNSEHTKFVWATTQGYLDAISKQKVSDADPRWMRAYLRERLSNLAVLLDMYTMDDYIHDSKQLLDNEISNLEKQIKSYFKGL